MKLPSPLLCAWAACAALVMASTLHATNYKVIVVSGQSNSGDWSYWGEGPLPDAVKTWINSPTCDALILTDNGDTNAADESLVTMYEEQQRSTNSQGYGQIVAYYADQYWKALDPDSKIVVVKKSVGATSLDYWTDGGRNTLNPWATGEPPWLLYYQAEGGGHAMLFSRIQRVQTLLTGSPIEGVGFIWYQGEGNAGDTSGNYFRNFLDLVNGATMVHDPLQPTWGDDPAVTTTNGIRQELGNPDMPFIVARISSEFIGWGSNFGPPNWEPGRQVTRADQVNATRELTPAAFIDVDDRPVNDQYHYTGTEYSIIGQRFADAWTQLADSPVIRPERTVFTGNNQTITITVPPGSATVYYTLDGSTPTSASTAYSVPFTLEQSATVKALAYRSGAPAGPVVEKRYTKLAALPAQAPAATASGVRVRAYLAENAAIFPGFETAMAPYNPSAITQTRLSRGLFSNYGWNILHCTSYINIPQDDVYEFLVTTRDWRQPDPDYRILIDDTPVDRHVALKAGLHRFRFDHFNHGLAILSVAIKGGTYTNFTLLAPEIYSHETTGGNPVSFEVSRLSVRLPAAAGSVESVFVTSDVTAWTAVSDQTWLTVSPGAGAWHETLALTALANSSGSERTATVTLSGSGATTRTFSVTQAAADAAPLEAVIASAAEGATTTLAITTGGAWRLAHESDPWFDCDPSAGTGNATVTIRARKNYRTTERVGWVQLDTGGVTPQRVKVRQSGEAPFVSPSATQVALVNAANANPVEFDSVLVRSNVNWTATSSASWLNVNASAQQTLNGSGNGRIWFLANQANPGAQAREGTVTITASGLPSQNITVIQPGTDPFLAAMPTSVVINRGEAATFLVATNQGSWSGSSDQSWLTVAKAAMPNRFVLKATPNATGLKRTAHVTVTSGTATPVIVPVTQNAAGKFLAFDPLPGTLGAGANQAATVLVDADEDWTVTSVSAPWLVATAGLPVPNGMTEPLLREHTPGLAPATERKLRCLLLNVASANTTGSSRQADVLLTSTSGATLTGTVTQASDVLSIGTSSLPNGTVGVSYLETLAASGGQTPYTWSLASGTLPGGLSLNTSSGVITGTPTDAGSSTFTIQVTDGLSNNATKQLTIEVVAVVAAPTFTPPADTYASAQTVTISSATSGATIRYTTDGTTPSQTVGTVYATPVSIAFTATLKAMAYKSGMADSDVTVGDYTIGGPTLLQNGGFETPSIATYEYNPTGSSWTFASNAGIQRNGSAWGAATAPEGVQTAFIQGSGGYGTISQSVVLTAGTYSVTFQAAQRFNSPVQPIAFKVDGTQVGSTISPTSTTFASYTTDDFTVTDGSHTISFAATDSTGDKASFIDAVTLNALGILELTITTSSLPNGTVNVAYAETLQKSGGVGPFAWTLTSGSLPAGLSLSTAGLISGTPSASGTSNFTVLVTDSLSATDTQALSIMINPPVVSNAVYEGFNYTPGTDLHAQTQPAQFNAWAGGHTPGYTTVAGSLSYTNGGTLATSGNALSGGNVWQTTGMSLNLSNSAWASYKVNVDNQYTIPYPGSYSTVIGKDNSTLYVSFLMQSTGDSAVFGLYSDGFSAAEPFSQMSVGTAVKVASSGALTLRVGSYTSGTFDVIPANGTNEGNHAVQDAAVTSVSAGSVNFYVLKIEFGASGNGQDKVSLFVNPTVGGSEPGTASASITANGNLVFNSFGIYLGHTAGFGKFDELRIGATWADVVPAVPPALTGLQAWLDANGLPTDGTGLGAPDADPAGDGITNLMKYALGLEALTPGYQGHLSDGLASDSGSNYLSLTFVLPEPAPEGVTFIPEVCGDLNSWSDVGLSEVSSTVLNDLRTITVRDTTAIGQSGPRFIRLKVAAP